MIGISGGLGFVRADSMANRKYTPEQLWERSGCPGRRPRAHGPRIFGQLLEQRQYSNSAQDISGAIRHQEILL